MNSLERDTRYYFSVPKGYFWKWAEGNEVIELTTGYTVCYRKDLVNILGELIPFGFPPLSVILLILIACDEKWNDDEEIEQVLKRVAIASPEILEEGYPLMISFMKTLAKLDASYRTGSSRIHLIISLCKELKTSYVNQPSKDILVEFESGRHDDDFYGKDQFTASRVKRDFLLVAGLGKKIPDVDILEVLLETGFISEKSEPLTDLPELNQEQSLMDQLLDDHETKTMAVIANYLYSTIQVPIHFSDQDDQQMGGISDISNKGNYDKLLISELAQDEDVLTARLVNNEALYFRRESPPTTNKTTRTLLIDSTIQTWGVVRLIEMSAALGITLKSEEKNELRAFALDGKGYIEFNPLLKEDIKVALSTVSPILSPAESITKLLQSNEIGKEEEFIFITTDLYSNSTEFTQLCSELKNVGYVVEVSHDCQVRMLQVKNSTRKEIFKSSLDLDEILKKEPKAKKDSEAMDPPSIYNLDKFPFYHPTIRVRNKNGKAWVLENDKALAITEDHRLLFWPTSEKGAVELARDLPFGKCVLGGDQDRFYYLMCYNKKEYFIYIIDTTAWSCDFAIGKRNEEVFKNNPNVSFHWNGYKGHFSIHNAERNILRIPDFELEKDEVAQATEKHESRMGASYGWEARSRYYNKQRFKQITNNGYSVITKFGMLFFTSNGQLVLGDYILKFENEEFVLEKYIKTGNLEVAIRAEFKSLNTKEAGCPYIAKYEFPNGCVLFIDSTGFIHIETNSSQVHDFSFTTLLGRTLSFYSNEELTGNPMFIDELSSVVKGDYFYKKYYLPFAEFMQESIAGNEEFIEL